MIPERCLHEVRWRGQGVTLLEERSYRLRWLGKGDEDGGMGVMVKEDLGVKVVVARRVSDGCCVGF